MTKKLLILTCLSLCFNSITMDLPIVQSAQQIPPEIQLKYNEERDRFRKYDLNNPEKKFLPLIRAQLQKDQAPFTYLDFLQTFANLLMAQHFMLNKAAEVNYLNNAMSKLRDEENQLYKEMGGVKHQDNTKGFQIYPPTIDALNEILAHKSILLKSSELLTPEELQTVFSWSFDDRFDPWMKLLSRNRILINIVLTTKQRRDAEIGIVDDQLSITLKKLESSMLKLPQLIQQNTRGIPELYEAYKIAKSRYQNYEAKGKQLETVRHSLWDDYVKAISKQGYLYQYTHSWYEQLYKIIRAEIAATIAQLIKSDPTKIKEITAHASNQFLNLIPEKILPVELPPFKEPIKTVTLFSLDKEKTEAKKIWDKQQEEKEVTRKKNTKINQTPDGNSFVLEFEDTPTSITIHNVKNKSKEIIFKHEHPFEIEKSGNKIPPINYTPWVKEWFTDPAKAIETQGYTDRTSKKFTPEADRWKPIALHAFSPLIDDYIKQWGRITSIKSRKNPAQQDLLITIPGKMIYPPGSNPHEEAGIFAYIIDTKNGQWYHRMFTPGTLSELTKNLFEKGYFSPEMTGYYEVFFPPLPRSPKP